MGTTSEFLKLRSTTNPVVGEWNADYASALQLAKSNYKFIVTCWSNGDLCSYCVTTEKCMMTDVFKNWMKIQDVYFVFQCSEDSDKGKTLHDWIYNGTSLTRYPGFRITLYDANGKILINRVIDGVNIRSNQGGINGANKMIDYLNKVFALKSTLTKKSKVRSISKSKSKSKIDYKIRLNEKLTVKQVNAILDAIDKNDGYCPCQIQSKDTKCHCKDFIENKKIGEPCICNIYVKMKK